MPCREGQEPSRWGDPTGAQGIPCCLHSPSSHNNPVSSPLKLPSPMPQKPPGCQGHLSTRHCQFPAPSSGQRQVLMLLHAPGSVTRSFFLPRCLPGHRAWYPCPLGPGGGRGPCVQQVSPDAHLRLRGRPQTHTDTPGSPVPRGTHTKWQVLGGRRGVEVAEAVPSHTLQQ